MTFLVSLLTGAWGRIAGLLALALGALFVARKSGADAVKAATEKERGDALSRMSDADAAGPRTGGDVVDRLRRGGF